MRSGEAIGEKGAETGMNMNLINTIIAVSRSKSFLDAAYDLNYTPAVVSKHIARAEKELGVRLFFRGNKANSVSMTPECETILDELVRIQQSWQRAENALELLRNSNRPTVRIGVGQRTWNYHEDEIIGDFIQNNPDISVDLTHGYPMDMLNSMVHGRIDGVFITMQGSTDDRDDISALRKKYDCDFFHVMDSSRMYLAISDRHELAKKDEAEFFEFRDFTIAINSDKLVPSGQKIAPFLELSKKYGMELKYTYLPTTDASAYRIAQNTVLAIPVPDDRLRFEGIKYIRLREWPTTFSIYFVTMKTPGSPALARFKKAVQAFSKADRE